MIHLAMYIGPRLATMQYDDRYTTVVNDACAYDDRNTIVVGIAMVIFYLSVHSSSKILAAELLLHLLS